MSIPKFRKISGIDSSSLKPSPVVDPRLLSVTAETQEIVRNITPFGFLIHIYAHICRLCIYFLDYSLVIRKVLGADIIVSY